MAKLPGTGKSTVLGLLRRPGHRRVDTGADDWSRWVTLPVGSRDSVWREQAISAHVRR